MKKIVALLLCCCIFFTGCGTPATNPEENLEYKADEDVGKEETQEKISIENNVEEAVPSFAGLDDKTLLPYIENTIYESVIRELEDDDFFVENVETMYLSQEYLEEFAYNSQSNVFFGYTLEEIEKGFQGKRYVFTLDEDGQTTVKELEEVYDDTYDRVIKNVAIGSGVILICVTISIVTAGIASTAAVSAVFAASATTGTVFALQSGTIGFAAASLARGYQTHDFEEAMKAGTLAASEGFKWGAVTGAIVGGGEEVYALKGASLDGLTMNEAAKIQRESKWSLKIIKKLHSPEEYTIYKDSELVPIQFSDKTWALTRKIDWKLVDKSGRTNIQRVRAGLAPIDSTGVPYELHHIGQKADAPLAILTKLEHMSEGNNKILHYAKEGKNISESAWNKQRKEFWKNLLNMELK